MVVAIKNAPCIPAEEIESLFDVSADFPSLESAVSFSNFAVSSRSPRWKAFSSKGTNDKVKQMLRSLRGRESRLSSNAQDENVFGLSADDSEIADLCSIEEATGSGINELTESEEPRILAALPESSTFEKDIEALMNERWRYLVMQSGGVFLNELRPERCAIGDKRLADELIRYDETEKRYGLKLDVLENYIRENTEGLIQVHFSDILLNPKTQKYEVFSVSSGDTEKAGIFIDLARFLAKHNKGVSSVIPVHLPYYEKWKDGEGVVEFGSLDENGKRDAIFQAEQVLRHFEKHWSEESVSLALETGTGESRRNGSVAFALIYEPHHLTTLVRGRESFAGICEDVGHLNITECDWKDYLGEHIREFHVSGNDGRNDQHTIASPKTLTQYHEIMSFLKVYSGNVCAEIGRGKLSPAEFVASVKNLAHTLFSMPDETDFKNLASVEEYVRVTSGEEGRIINPANFNAERHAAYEDFKAQAS